MGNTFIRIFAVADGSALLLDPSKIDFWTWAIIAGVLLLLGSMCALALRVRYWWKEGRKLVNEPGHITPRAPSFARFTRWVVSNLFCRRYIGPFKKLNWHKVKYDGRLIVLVNHQTERDALVIPAAMGFRVVRALMAVTQIFGIRVPAAAWMGIVAVHHDKNPMASLRGMIKVLQQDEDSDCIVFPQGELVRDNHLDRKMFFAGSMMIAKKTSQKSKRKVAVLPAAIVYDRNPAHASWLQRLVEWCGWKDFRVFFGDRIYGGALAFGEPIPVEQLPDDYDKAMDVVFAEIVKLSAQGEAALKRPGDNPQAA